MVFLVSKIPRLIMETFSFEIDAIITVDLSDAKVVHNVLGFLQDYESLTIFRVLGVLLCIVFLVSF